MSSVASVESLNSKEMQFAVWCQEGRRHRYKGQV